MHALPSLITIPFVLALLALPMPSRYAGRLALLGPASTLWLGLPLWPAAPQDSPARLPIPWIPALGITADLRLDHHGAFFVLLVGAVGLVVFQYARHYLGDEGHGPFWATLLAFMGSMLGLVLSDSLVLLFVFWELTTITSALLIGLDVEDAAARRGAVQAFLVTSGGALALLAGVILLGQLSGTTTLSELEPRGAALSADPAHALPLALLLVGAFTKSAQFPFHFWLPGAMTAPAPVSAYLHSATMVQAGVFLVGRLFPIFHTSPLWFPALVTVGLVTFVVAGWQALRAWDLKELLAHSTAAYLGMLMALYGLYARTGTRGEIVNIANHALYKSALFLLAGWLEKATGTRDLSVLRRERWLLREPLGCALLGIGAMALAGAPLLLGFISKELFYEDLLAEGPLAARLLIVPGVAGSALTVAYGLKLLLGVAWGAEAPPVGRGYPRTKLSGWLLATPAVLLIPQVLGGLAPGLAGSALEPGAAWPRGVAVWHHLDILLALSMLGYALGAAGYLTWRRLARGPAPSPRETPQETTVKAALAAARRVGRAVQAGGHPRYLAITLLAATTAIALPLVQRAPARGAAPLLPALRVAWLPVGMILAGALLTLWAQGRTIKLLMMAIAGYGTALLYILFRAPDLALTQILVETVSLLLLLLVFRKLPEIPEDVRPRAQRLAHAAIAVLAGTAVAALAWAAGVYPAPRPAGEAQLALALPEAKGRNVVNVILVDFRGVDTLGEIAVLAIAALGALALITRDRGSAPQGRSPAAPGSAPRPGQEAPCDR